MCLGKNLTNMEVGRDMEKETKALRQHIEDLVLSRSVDWLSKLESRKVEEAEFHDDSHAEPEVKTEQAEQAAKFKNKKYYSTVERSATFVQEWLCRQAKDAVFLDFACGNGNKTIEAAEAGASLALGIDISPVSIANGQRRAEQLGLNNVLFFQTDAENTGLPDNSVDAVLCSGVLHHMKVENVYPELQRIVRPGGRILAIEALNYNPFIKLYRRITPEMRTHWEKEHILSLREVNQARQYFSIVEIRYWHVLSYLAAFVPTALPVLQKVDKVLTKIPFVQRMAWMFTFELEVSE